MKKILFLILMCEFFSGCDLKDKAAFLQTALRYQAKETCSCYYVEEQSAEFCKNSVHLSQIENNIKIDEQKKTVSSSFIWTKGAIWLGPEQGCVLQD